MKYEELKNKHARRINDFPMAFAFSQKQFEEAKQKLGVTDSNELLSIPSGGMIRKTDKEAYKKLVKILNEESEEALKDDEYLLSGFIYELGNHEYCITYNPTDTMDCFGLDVDNIDDRIRKIFAEARKIYLAGCEDY